jgi:hypothetical protein
MLCAGAATAETVLSEGDITVMLVPDGTSVAFKPEAFPRDAAGMTVRILGPTQDKERGDAKFDALLEIGDELPNIDLAKLGDLVDGTYRFELTGTTGERVELKEKLNDGRDKPASVEFLPFALSGKLFVTDGKIVEFDQFEEKVTEGSKPGDDKIFDGDEGAESKRAETNGRDVFRTKDKADAADTDEVSQKN